MLTNRSMPRSTVIPQLPYPDVRGAAAWLCDAFGFSIRILMGNHRAQLNVSDGAIVVTELGATIRPVITLSRLWYAWPMWISTTTMPSSMVQSS